MNNTSITWETSNSEVITNDGKVTRPSYKEGDTEVTLIAKIIGGDVTRTKEFAILVPSKVAGQQVVQYQLNGDLSNTLNNQYKEGIVIGNRINSDGGNITFTEGFDGGG